MEKIPTIKELREICKVKRTGYWDNVTTYLGFYPAKLFLYLPFTPNQITVIWVLIKTIMALLMLTGNYLVMVIALLFFQLASILDATDGVVARYRKHFSLNGIYIDFIGHYFCNSLLLVTIGIGLYFQTGVYFHIIPAFIGMFSMLLSKALTVNLAWYKNLEQREKVNKILYDRGISLKVHKNNFILLLTDFLRLENPLSLLFWGLLLGYPGLVLWVYALFLSLEMGRKLFFQFLRINRAERKNEL